MGTIWTANLTADEAERYAYLQGNALLACYAADADDLTSQVDGFDDQLTAAKEEAFEAGKQAGLEIDASQTIADLETELASVKASHQRCRDNMLAIYDWLRSDDCKTAKTRHAFEKRVLTALHATPRY